ncbi:MAG: hypothetical protein NVS9B10_26770 [Nevskia sp.]
MTMHDNAAGAAPLSPMTPLGTDLVSQLINAMPSHVALLDRSGVIVMVNDAWHGFASAILSGAAGAGVGQNYPALCEAERGECAVEAHRIAAGIRSVLDNTRPTFRLDYPCHASDRERWFRLSVTPFNQGPWRGGLMMQMDITDLIRAERLARESESRYRAIFDRSSLPMWVFDPASLRFLAVNDAAIEQYGYSREEFMAMTLADIRPSCDVPALRARLADLDQDNQRAEVWPHRLKSGAIIRVETRAEWMPWDGRRARLVTALDVTERLADADALRDSEKRFRELAASISDVFWLSDVGQRKLLYLSPAYDKIWGVSGDVVRKNPRLWRDSIHPDDLRRVLNSLKIPPVEGYQIEYRIVRPDGGIRWISVRTFPIRDADGILRRLAGLATDTTERHVEQDRLHLLETAISKLNDIVVITEAEPFDEPGPRILFVNDAFERLTGYRRDEVIGRTPRMLQGPETQRAELDRIRTALERWEPVRAELINYTKSGEKIWLELEIVPIANSTGWFTHWVAVERDITERKTVQDRLRQSERLESLGQLTGGVAHDFNNLLTVIQGNAEILSEQLSSQPQMRKLALMIGKAAERSAELTRSLLAFARKQPLAPRLVEVNRLLVEMDPLLRRSLGEHVEVRLHCGENLWMTLVDRGQLENAVLNLAINARDAMPGGGILTIETANLELDPIQAAQNGDLPPGRYVTVVVADTGTGIAPAHQARVFEPFFTTKERGKGTGLGLAMVYGFVKQSNGHIALDSSPGLGTRIRIYLPQVPELPPQEQDDDDADVAAGLGQRILLVEDDAMVRDCARRQVAELGYRVLEAGNAREALALLHADPDIDLLFTDVVMPGGMSGYELAREASRLRPALPVLYTSGYSSDVMVHDGRLDPGVMLLAKPYKRRELARKLRDALRLASSNRAPAPS